MRADEPPKSGRRIFLRGMLAATALTGLPGTIPLSKAEDHAAAEASPAKNIDVPKSIPSLGQREQFLLPHAAFRELQLGQVRPEGWLRGSW